ncbi:hypothetical protein GN241_11005 [Rhodobacteraceae bacterium IMCC1335]
MSQYDRDIGGQTSGLQLVDDFNLSMSAIHSGHIGPTRPPYAERGMTWTREGSPDQLMYFDGTTDIALFSLNESLAGQIGTPPGGIIMWHGSVANIPVGWSLCDGQNGTPDLRGRFLIGAGGDYAPGATGGSDEITLSMANLPPHSHGAGTLSASQAGEHSHTGTISAAGNHNHVLDRPILLSGSIINVANSYSADGYAVGRTDLYGSSDTVPSGGTHSHALNLNSADGHNHGVTGDTASTGSGQPFGVLPPYYALCYIMKV